MIRRCQSAGLGAQKDTERPAFDRQILLESVGICWIPWDVSGCLGMSFLSFPFPSHEAPW